MSTPTPMRHMRMTATLANSSTSSISSSSLSSSIGTHSKSEPSISIGKEASDKEANGSQPSSVSQSPTSLESVHISIHLENTVPNTTQMEILLKILGKSFKLYEIFSSEDYLNTLQQNSLPGHNKFSLETLEVIHHLFENRIRQAQSVARQACSLSMETKQTQDFSAEYQNKTNHNQYQAEELAQTSQQQQLSKEALALRKIISDVNANIVTLHASQKHLTDHRDALEHSFELAALDREHLGHTRKCLELERIHIMEERKALAEAQTKLSQGQTELAQGHTELAEAQAALAQGQNELLAAQEKLLKDQASLKTERDNLSRAIHTLKQKQAVLRQDQDRVMQAIKEVQALKATQEKSLAETQKTLTATQEIYRQAASFVEPTSPHEHEVSRSLFNPRSAQASVNPPLLYQCPPCPAPLLASLTTSPFSSVDTSEGPSPQPQIQNDALVPVQASSFVPVQANSFSISHNIPAQMQASQGITSNGSISKLLLVQGPSEPIKPIPFGNPCIVKK